MMPHKSQVLKTRFCTSRTSNLKKNRGKNDLKRLKRHNLIWRGLEEMIWKGTIWSSDLPSKNEEEGKTIWWRWRSPTDEETQNEEWSNDEEQRWRKLGLKMVKLESLKLEFHLDFYPHQAPPLTNRDLKTRFLS